jgi:drug/metabolite transporter (DMT)-like permease
MPSSFKPPQIIGAVTVVIGTVLLLLAWRGSGAPADQISDALTGSYTDRTTMYLLLGIGALVGGVLLMMFGRRKS